MSQKWLNFLSHEQMMALVNELGAKVQYVRVETKIGDLEGIRDPNQPSFQNSSVMVSIKDVKDLLQESLYE